MSAQISPIHPIIFAHSCPMMDWIGVLESSRQALSIAGSITSKYRCFDNELNSVGGFRIQNSAPDRLKIFRFSKVE